MGSVISFIDCPHCNGKETAHDEFWYKSGEQSVFCSECGYSYQSFYKRDDDGNLVRKDESNKSLNFDNLILETNEIKPYSAYHIKTGQGFGQMGALLTEGDFRDFCRDMLVHINESASGERDGNSITYIESSRFYNGNIMRDTLYDYEGDYNRLAEFCPDPMLPELEQHEELPHKNEHWNEQ